MIRDVSTSTINPSNCTSRRSGYELPASRIPRPNSCRQSRRARETQRPPPPRFAPRAPLASSSSSHPGRAVAMAPPCQGFPVKHLPARAQIGADGKVRKTEDGGRIDLARDCELLGLLQYDCVVERPEFSDSPVTCWPVQRWFRRWVGRLLRKFRHSPFTAKEKALDFDASMC